MTDEERLLWAALAESERRMAQNEEPLLGNHRVNVGIRVELRDKFGLNLDVLCGQARDVVERRLKADARKERAERAKQKKVDALLRRGRELLKK